MTTAAWAGRARAKINLRLRVLARDPSGYHDLDTVFQSLELADEISLSWTDGPGVSMQVEGVPEGALGRPEENLAVIAATRFHERVGRGGAHPGLHIHLRKRIPHGAGLGGGSSDAATVLRGMNELAGGPLGRTELIELGAEIGADVAFFVSDVPRARGRGRGDQISPVVPLPSRPVLLLLPEKPVSTGWAYETLAAARKTGVLSASSSESAPGIPGDWRSTASDARNDFEAALFPLRPELGRIRASLESAGAEFAMLSGSGSAVFGVFRAEDDLDRALERLDAEPSPPWVRSIRTATSE